MADPKPVTIQGTRKKKQVPTDPVDNEQLKVAEDLVNHVRDWFVETRKDEATILHNEFVNIIQARKPPVEVLISTLEILKHEAMKGFLKRHAEDANGE